MNERTGSRAREREMIRHNADAARTAGVRECEDVCRAAELKLKELLIRAVCNLAETLDADRELVA